MSQQELTLTSYPEVDTLISQAKSIQSKISANENLLAQKTEHALCPICQEGYLYSDQRGKVLGFIPHKWLVCNKCNAEFDKTIMGSARLVKSENDPYGIFKKYANQTLSLDKWKQISVKGLHETNFDLGDELSGIRDRLGEFVAQQFLAGKFNVILADVSHFILKQNEVPLFGTKAELIEERKRRVT